MSHLPEVCTQRLTEPMVASLNLIALKGFSSLSLYDCFLSQHNMIFRGSVSADWLALCSMMK